MYAGFMRATEFRKNLFQTLERASKGDSVTIEYKGVLLRLEALGSRSKLAGAVRRNAIVGDPDLLVGSDSDLLDELEVKWARESPAC